MPTGKVKWYDKEKGFGFLAGEDGQEVFLPKSALPEGVTDLKAGTRVEFGVADGRKGAQALGLRVLDKTPSIAKAKRPSAKDLAPLVQDLVRCWTTSPERCPPESTRKATRPRPSPSRFVRSPTSWTRKAKAMTSEAEQTAAGGTAARPPAPRQDRSRVTACPSGASASRTRSWPPPSTSPAAAVEGIAPAEQVGRHLAVKSEGDRLVTHLFESKLPGYGGWQWYAVLTRNSRSKMVTVDELGLLPSEDSILAPEWVPWAGTGSPRGCPAGRRRRDPGRRRRRRTRPPPGRLPARRAPGRTKRKLPPRPTLRLRQPDAAAARPNSGLARFGGMQGEGRT